ncbi:unnamed protein product [Ixodes persulcatus]
MLRLSRSLTKFHIRDVMVQWNSREKKVESRNCCGPLLSQSSENLASHHNENLQESARESFQTRCALNLSQLRKAMFWSRDHDRGAIDMAGTPSPMHNLAVGVVLLSKESYRSER